MSFLPLDLTATDSLEMVISHIDYTMQYGEDEEPKEVKHQSQPISGAGLISTVHASRMTLTKGIFRIWSKHTALSLNYVGTSGACPSLICIEL